MRARSLVAFTVLGQAAAGMLAALAVVRWWVGPFGRVGAAGAPGVAAAAFASGTAGAPGAPVPDAWLLAPLVSAGGLLVVAGAAAVLHLGSPRNAWRAVAGVGSSWLSREIALAGLLGVGWTALVAVVAVGGWTPDGRAVGLAAVAALGLGLVYAMARVYRLRTVPGWDSVMTTASFFLTAIALGSLAVALALSLSPPGWEPANRGLTWAALAGLMARLALAPLVRAHRAGARARVDPGLWPAGPDRGTGLAQIALLAAAIVATLAALFMATVGAGSIGMALVPPSLAVALAAALVGEAIGRAAFYDGYARTGL